MNTNVDQSKLLSFQRAARMNATAGANVSDPFCFNRMMTHLLNGIEDVAEVVKEARTKGGVA